MRTIRDGQTILGLLENGQLAADFGSQITELIAYLKNQTGGRSMADRRGR